MSTRAWNTAPPFPEERVRIRSRVMLVYGATMFLSAFLLFLVQPMIGKFILPWFGGALAVWTTCMLFFQALLLAGHAYAHGLATYWTLRRQARVHVALLIASSVAVLWLSIAPSPEWKPAGDQSPVGRILGLLLVSIGAPFLLLSATAPLLQSWFSRTRPERFPYRLYALSNLGSLLAILSYPFLIEPTISLHRQASIWSWTYVVFALACGLVAESDVHGTPAPDERSNRGSDREARCRPPSSCGLVSPLAVQSCSWPRRAR